MVSRTRTKQGAKNRLRGRRVAVPAVVANLVLPDGCPVQKADLANLFQGTTALDQLVALKAIVASLGIRKDCKTVDPTIPGALDVIAALLRILPEPGSKPLHEEIRGLLQALPSADCKALLAAFIDELLGCRNHEMILTVGALCGVPAARASLAEQFERIVLASVEVLNGLNEAVSWSRQNGMNAEVQKALAQQDDASEKAKGDEDGDNGDETKIAEPEMLCFCMHAINDLLSLCSPQLAAVLANATAAAAPPSPILDALVPCLLALLRNAAVQKDALTGTSIALCSLLDKSHPAVAVRAAQLAVAAGCTDALDRGTLKLDERLAGARLLLAPPGGASSVLPEGCYSLDHAALPAFAQQALLRAVLSAGTRKVLTEPLGATREGGAPGESLLFSLLVRKIAAECSSTADLFLVCYGLQTTAYALDLVCEAATAVLTGSAAQEAKGAGGEGEAEEGREGGEEGEAAGARREEEGVRRCGTAAELGGIGGIALSLLWPHCEDPFQGIADQTKAMFTAITELRELTRLLERREAGEAAAMQLSAREKAEVFRELTTMALAVKPNRKARYRLLVAIVPRVGCEELLGAEPQLVASLLEAMRDQSVGTCCTLLLEAMLVERAAAGVEDAGWWRGPVVAALLAADARLRHALCNYALPTLAKNVPGSMAAIVRALQGESGGEGGEVLLGGAALWAVTAAMKVARRCGGSGRDGGAADGAWEGGVSKLLRAAAVNVSDDLRLNALEMVCLHPKATEAPSAEELAVVREFLSLNMKSASSHYRQRCTELLKKLFVRLRISRQHILSNARKAKRGVRDDKGGAFAMPPPDKMAQVQAVDDFLAWLVEHVIAALFPGGSYERNIMSLELYVTAIDVWKPKLARHPDPAVMVLSPSEEEEAETDAVLFRTEAVQAVLNALVNSFDYVRKQAYEVLSRFPAPLPGWEDREAVLRLLQWAQSLVSSPRARESDAGSLIVKAVHLKYAKELGWLLPPSGVEGGAGALQPREREPPSLYFVRGLLGEIDKVVEAAMVNFEATFASSFAQGVLLCLRQVVPDLRMPSLLAGKAVSAEEVAERAMWREVVEGVLERMRRLAGIAILAMAGTPPERVGGAEGERPVVVGGAAVSTGLFGSLYRKPENKLSTPHSVQRDSLQPALAATQRNTTGAAGGGGGVEAKHTHVDSLVVQDQGLGEEEGDEDGLAGLGPKEQLLVVSCWLTLKEVGLTLGTTVGAVPMETEEYLDRGQLISAGNLLLDIIFSTLHNGAIEKARLGFHKLCEKLLRCPRPQVRFLPSEWLDRLLERLYDHEVPVVRRSSQLSFSLLAILDAEPSNSQRVLLERAMAFLLAAAEASPPPSPPAVKPEVLQDAGAVLRAQVHALNILRHVFLDTSLAKEVAAFLPRAMLCALRGFGAHSWAVRNSSTLAFSVLLSRSMGGAHQRKTFSAGEFFLRYPSLCPALLERLARATEALLRPAGRGAPESLHPELQPVLVLLAQLTPAAHVREDLRHLDAFVPLIERCVGYNNAMVRAMAARALTPFVPVHAVPAFVKGILERAGADHAPREPGGAWRRNNELHGRLEEGRRLVLNLCSKEESWADIMQSIAERGAWMSLWQALEASLGMVRDARMPPPSRLLLLQMTGDSLWSPAGVLLAAEEGDSEEGAVLRTASARLRARLKEVCAGLLEDNRQEGESASKGAMLEVLLGGATRLLVREKVLEGVRSERGGEVGAAKKAVGEAMRRVGEGRYEERWMALRGVKEAVLGRMGFPRLGEAVGEGIRAAVQERVGKEENMWCQRKMLRVLLSFEGRGAAGAGGRGGGRGWSECQALLGSTDPKVRERGLALSGEVAGEVVAAVAKGEGEGVEGAVSVLEDWVGRVESGADEEKHVEEREAAVAAVCRSRVLEINMRRLPEKLKPLAPLLARTWVVALRLLQDDDEDARASMAEAVSEAVLGARGGEKAAATSVKVQPAKAIELLFEHVGAEETDEAAKAVWWGYLATVLEGPAEEGAEAAGEEVVGDGVMSRRLFEKECDNFQAEEVLLLQLAALHCRRRAAATGGGGGAVRALGRLREWVGALVKRGDDTNWAGGVTCRMDIFLRTYRMLMAVHAEGSAGAEGAAAAVAGIAQSLASLNGHPVLCTTLCAVAADLGAGDAAGAVAGVRLERLPLLFLTSGAA